MTVGSLFSGIGGLDLGLERAGMTVRWQVEIDPYCLRVLAKHWPDVPRYGDIRELTGEELEPVDLICGGFPCQDVSNAGKRAGIDGERSGLWAEYARIVRVLRPRYVLVENVAALLTRGVGRVLGDLAACGYDAEWDCIPAGAVGAPHIRDRAFILAHTAVDLRGAPRDDRSTPSDGRGDMADAQGGRRAGRDARNENGVDGAAGCRQDMADAARLGPQGRGPRTRGESDRQAARRGRLGGGRGAQHLGHPAGARLAVWQDPEGLRQFAATVGARVWPRGDGSAESALGVPADGVPGRLGGPEPWERGEPRTILRRARGERASRIDQLRALGNAVVPQVAEYIGRRIMAAAEPPHRHAWTLASVGGRKTLRCDCGEMWDNGPYRQEYREWVERRSRRRRSGAERG